MHFVLHFYMMKTRVISGSLRRCMQDFAATVEGELLHHQPRIIGSCGFGYPQFDFNVQPRKAQPSVVFGPERQDLEFEIAKPGKFGNRLF